MLFLMFALVASQNKTGTIDEFNNNNKNNITSGKQNHTRVGEINPIQGETIVVVVVVVALTLRTN